MAKYGFRILIDTTKGKQFSYYTSSLFDSSVDSSNYALSASEVWHRITGSFSCSYQNTPTFDGTVTDPYHSNVFRINNYLSSSLSGSADTGSIEFIYPGLYSGDKLRRFKFYGSKVCNVINVEENFWYYPQKFILQPGSSYNYFEGNVNAVSLNVRKNFGIFNSGYITSDLPFINNKSQSRWIKFVNTASNNHDLKLGYNDDTDTYELIADSASVNFDIKGVRSLHVTDITSSFVTSSTYFIESNGNTRFGDSVDDNHIFTGSVFMSGDLDVSLRVSSSYGLWVKSDKPTTVGNITASGNISASGTGSFSNLEIAGIGGAELIVAGDISASGQLIATSADFNDGNITNVGTIAVDAVKADTDGNVELGFGTGGISFNAAAGDKITFNDGANNVDLEYSDENETVIFKIDQSEAETSVIGSLDVTGHITASGNISSSETITMLTASIGGGTFTSASLAAGGGGGGAIDISGTPVNNQLAVWTDADTLEGESELTYDGTTLTVAGHISASGDIDVDGTTNLDAVDIDGNVQLDGNLSIGVDDTGYDFNLYGATSGRRIYWSSTYDTMHVYDNTKLTFGTPLTGGGHDAAIYADGSNLILYNLVGAINIQDSVLISGSGDVTLTVAGHISASGNISASGDISGNRLTLTGSPTGGSGTIDAGIYFKSGLNIAGLVDGIVTKGSVTASGDLYIEDKAVIGGTILSSKTLTVAGTISGSGGLWLSSYNSHAPIIYLQNDGATSSTGLSITSGSDNIIIQAKMAAEYDLYNKNINSKALQFSSSYGGTVVFDYSKHATVPYVGIGADKPTKPLQVEGDISASGQLIAEGSMSLGGGIFTSASLAAGGGGGSATTLTAGTVNATTYGITSDGGADDIVLPEATTTVAGLLGADKWDEIVANTAKNTNVSTTLTAGTVNATTYGITSDGGADDIVLPEATTTVAGLLGADKWDEIVANTAHAADSSQAHSDYLINNGNDTTSGTITAGGFVGATIHTTGSLANGESSGGDIMRQLPINGDQKGKVLYLTSGDWRVADKDYEARTGGLLGVALGDDGTTDVLVKGFVRLAAGGIADAGGDDGDVLYVGDDGAVTFAPSTTSGDFVRVIGYCIDEDDDLIWFDPDKTWIEVA